MKLFKHLKHSVLVSVVFLILCGLGFPMLMTGISQVIFPHQANGSLIEYEGKAIGSEHVGQDFNEPYFMKARPSAVGYNTDEEVVDVASGSNNYGPSNELLKERVQKDMDEFLKQNPDVKKEDIPTDLLTASGSGLDPHISIESARIQIPALSKASGIKESELETIVQENTEGKWLGIFGEDVVNVLKVNLEIAKRL